MKHTTNPFTGKTNSYVTPLTEILSKHGFNSDRMICGSKSLYLSSHEGNKVYFNACIFDENAIQVWWGDLDLTVDSDELQKVANKYGSKFYVSSESLRSDFNNTSVEDLEKSLDPEFEDWFPRVVKFEAKK